jgi:hypothetical protein
MYCRITVSIVAVCLLGGAPEVLAQESTFLPVAELETTAPSGAVDVLIEADTYVPAFYHGRAEPTSGNPIRLVAVPIGAPADTLTYHWSINGRSLASTGPTATTTAPLGDNFLLRLVVRENGRLWAERNERVAISSPQVFFYEKNSLRGRASTAVRDSYNLIGDEAEIVAVPYFTSLNSGSGGLNGTWRMDGQMLNLDSWQSLILTRPEEPKDRYTVQLEVINRNNLAETAENSFYLHMGL